MAFTPATPLEMVEALYIGYFGRAGEPGGVQYWVDQIQAGRTFAQVAAAFSVQQEAKDQHPFLANPDLVSPADFIESLYSQLLGRASDAEGKAYWVAQASAAVGNPFALGLLVAQFISGAQGDDITVLQNKIDAAEYFTGKLASANIQGVDAQGQVLADVDVAATNAIAGVTKDASSIDASKAITDEFVGNNANPGSKFVLTTDIETVDGTTKNDTISGLINDNGGTDKSTFQTGDIVNGNGGVDTLNLLITDDNGPLVELNSVERVFIRDLDGGSVDASAWTGTTEIWNDRSTSSTSVTNVQNGVVLGGYQTNSDISLSYEADKLGSAKYVQEMVLNNYGDENNTLDTHIDANGGDAITGYSIKATGSNYLEIGGGSNNTIESLVITGTGAVEISDHGSNFGDAKVIDLSGNSGGVTLGADLENVVITGGTGADIISIGNGVALTNKASISLGAGDDSLLDDGSVGVGTSAPLDGGEGKDTISSTLLEVGNIANIKNFEILDLAGEQRTITASLFNQSAIESLALSGALLGNTTVNGLAGTAINVDITASSGAFDLTAILKDSSGTADSATLNFDTDGNETVQNFISTGLESVNIVAGGEDGDVNTLSNLSVTSNTLTTVTLTGAQDFVLTDVDTNSAATAVVATTTASALTKIDGSAATGDLNITAGTSDVVGNVTTTYFGLTVSTGSGDDIVNFGGKGTVNLGTGSDTANIALNGVLVDVGADEDVDSVVLATTTAFSTNNTDFTAASKGVAIANAAEGDLINVSAFDATWDTADITNGTAQALTFGSLEAAINDAIDNGPTDIVFINWIDNQTYVVIDDAADGDQALVRLVGTYDDFTAAAGVLTIG